MDLKESKNSKVLRPRQDFDASEQQPDGSSATQTVQDHKSREFCDTATPDNAKLCSNSEPVNGPIIQDKEQLNTEGVQIAQETQLAPEQERSDELVFEKKDASCVTNILPSSKNREEIVKARICQEIRARKHPIRLTRTGKCGGYKNCFHVTMEHDFPSHQAKGRTVFEQCKQKVGLVRCLNCGNWGTCFRIGKCDIVTCYHSISNSKCTATENEAVFYHQGPNQQDTRVYRMIKKNVNIELDYAIYELYSDGKSFPPAFMKFRDLTHADGSSEYLVYLICFQIDAATEQIELDVHSDTVRLNSNAFDNDRFENLNDIVDRMYPETTPENPDVPDVGPYWNADMHRDYGHVPLMCKVINGGSGGVGVFLDGNGDVVVDFMYKAGFPGFFYETNTEADFTSDEKENFPGCLLVEVGLDIWMII